MALGGGTFVTQNKVLPGAYINFISTANTGTVFGERGVCAAPLNIGWGTDNQVIEVTAEDFEKNSLKIFGYPYTANEMKPYRDLFKNAQKCYFYKVMGGAKASASFGTARCSGTRGNSIFYTVTKNVDKDDYYDVCTYIRTTDSTVNPNKIYDFSATRTISTDFVNVGGKAVVTYDNSGSGDNNYYCVIDGVRDGTDIDSSGKPSSRALGLVNIITPRQIKITFKNECARYARLFGSETGTRTASINGNTAIFNFSSPSAIAKEDIYIYGTDKIYISKIEIVYQGAASDDLVDKQTVQGNTSYLVDNDFIVWTKNKTITETAGTFLHDGANFYTSGSSVQDFLSAIESYTFNILICDSYSDTVKGLFVNFTKRLRDKAGIKFQTIVHNYGADYEGVINLTTDVSQDMYTKQNLVWWLGGVESNCEINKSCTNKKYDGEYTPICSDTQTGLEQAINNGELKLHKVGSDYRILTDINSLVTTTSEKSDLFCSNQTMRVCDQIGMDIATIFNTRYLGVMPNDNAGRIALWADIVKYLKNLETLRAIEDFTDTDVVVEQGEVKKAVVVNTPVTVVNCMEQLYMTVKVN